MDQRLGSVTPDGRTVLFGLMNMADYGSDLLLVDVDGGAPLRPYLVGPGFEGMPSLSPDGRWVVYLADASGRMEVWVADFPEARGRWQISTGFSPSAGLEALTVADIRFGGGIGYGWMSEDEIYWQDTEGRVSAVTIRARGGDLEISARALLAGRRLTPTERLLDYSFARERFLIARAEGPDPAPVFVVLSDWRAALRVGAQR
jgi:dipeptidyl aminopeptidase/acylaminoacyl peptidase